MIQELGWSKTDSYSSLTIALLSSAAASPVIGAMIDKGHGKKVMTLGAIFSGLLLFLWSGVESKTSFYIILSGIGVAQSATLYNAAFALVYNFSTFINKRESIVKLTLWGGLASTVFIPFIELILTNYDWRTTLTLLGLINIVVCATIYSKVPIHNVNKECSGIKEERNQKKIIYEKAFFLIVATLSLYSGVVSALRFHFYPLLIEKGFENTLSVTFLALIGPSQVIGRILTNIFFFKFETLKLAILITSIFAVAQIFFSLFQLNIFFMSLYFISFGFTEGIMTIIKATVIKELWPSLSYGSSMGIINIPITIFKSLAPLFIALVWDLSMSYQHIGKYIAIISILVVLSLIYVRDKKSLPLIK